MVGETEKRKQEAILTFLFIFILSDSSPKNIYKRIMNDESVQI